MVLKVFFLAFFLSLLGANCQVALSYLYHKKNYIKAKSARSNWLTHTYSSFHHAPNFFGWYIHAPVVCVCFYSNFLSILSCLQLLLSVRQLDYPTGLKTIGYRKYDLQAFFLVNQIVRCFSPLYWKVTQINAKRCRVVQSFADNSLSDIKLKGSFCQKGQTSGSHHHLLYLPSYGFSIEFDFQVSSTAIENSRISKVLLDSANLCWCSTKEGSRFITAFIDFE